MNVKKFYNEEGWSEKKTTKDAILFEDLRLFSKNYISHCRKKINYHIPRKGIH
jgi:hypothetical protein